MITQSELEIANKSYIEKDFESIYLDMLAKATLLSSRFDPTNSNESDPFIILLKLVAFIADKLNYNIDKNILEKFMLSCTQKNSMTQLTEMLGYRMHYYIAAKTNVIFKYTFPSDFEEDSIIVPEFSIILNNNEDIQYLTTSTTLINKSTGMSDETTVIQGILKTFTIYDSETVQLENLDSNNRLYFPELMVAENGVFISGGSSSDSTWEAVDNLNSQTYGSACYKFGFDSELDKPYIEFPEWMNEIIGEGLSIKYVVTSGSLGNVAAKALTSVQRSDHDDDEVEDSDITVVNTNAAITGDDPETMTAGYNGFKKLIGTFDTLVTCRDYMNYIYDQIKDLNDQPIVSNINVSDRRNDLNASSSVVSYSEEGLDYKIIPQDMTAFDLRLYPLKPITDYSYAAYDWVGGYNKSYDLLEETLPIESALEDTKSISHDYKKFSTGDIINVRDYYVLEGAINTQAKVNSLEQIKILDNVNTALIEKFNAREVDLGEEIPFDTLLSTIEQADTRIKSVSLYEPTQVPKIYYVKEASTVQDVLKLAEVPLYEKDETTGIVTWHDTYKKIIAQNILSGSIQLFDYNEDFKYGFDQQNMLRFGEVDKITTGCGIERLMGNDEGIEYKLSANEILQFISPSLITDVTYPYGINYYLKLTSGDYIPKETNYKLSGEDQLIFYYTNSSNKEVFVEYKAGDIVYPNLNLYTTEYRETTSLIHTAETPTKKNIEYNGNYYDFFTLSTNDQVEHKVLNEETVNNIKKCYWYLNNNNVVQVEEDDELVDKFEIPFIYKGTEEVGEEIYYIWEYILEEDEYFFYTDLDYSYLSSYGSGTTISIRVANNYTEETIRQEWRCDADIDITSLLEEGLISMKEIFITKNFTELEPLVLRENEILSLLENDLIIAIDDITKENYLKIPDNTWTLISDCIYDKEGEIATDPTLTLYYQLADDEDRTLLDDRSSLGEIFNWKIRSVLDINCGPSLTQTLQSKTTTRTEGETKYTVISKNQYFNFHIKGDDEDVRPTISGTDENNSIRLNNFTQKTGGVNVSMMYYDINLNENYPTLAAFKLNTSTDNLPLKLTDNEYKLDVANTTEFSIPLFTKDTVIEKSEEGYTYKYIYGKNIFMFYYKNKNSTEKPLYINSDEKNLRILNHGDWELYNQLELLPKDSEVYIIEVDTEDEKYDKPYSITITTGEETLSSAVVVMSCLKINEGINSYLGTRDVKFEITEKEVIEYLNKNFEEAWAACYVGAEVENKKQLELSETYPLGTGESFFNSNNRANAWTIPIINFSENNLRIARSSTK